MNNGANAATTLAADLHRVGGAGLGARLRHHYAVECIGADGKLKWSDEFDNLVVTEGENKYLDATLKTGLASPAWFVGLKGTGTPQDGDTLPTHATWSELNPYSGNRPAWTPGAISAGSVDNSASKASFSITSGTTVYGAFMASVNTGTSGTLLGAGDFTGGSRAVVNGDTLNVTVTCSIAGT